MTSTHWRRQSQNILTFYSPVLNTKKPGLTEHPDRFESADSLGTCFDTSSHPGSFFGTTIFSSCFSIRNWFMQQLTAVKYLIFLFLQRYFKFNVCNFSCVRVSSLLRQSLCLRCVADALWLTCRQFPMPKYLLNELRLNWRWTPACSSSQIRVSGNV